MSEKAPYVKPTRADCVLEGEWVRWPHDSGTVRLIDVVERDDEAMMVRLWSSYDDYDYELMAHQIVHVCRMPDAR